MGIFRNIKNRILMLRRPIRLGENINLTHHEIFYNDKQKAYSLKKIKLIDSIEIYTEYSGKTSHFIEQITNIINYINSEKAEPLQYGKDIKLYYEKLRTINELFSVIKKGIPIKNSGTLKEVDIIVGIIKSTNINAQLGEINNHINKIDTKLKNTNNLIKKNYNDFDYKGWKETIISELSLIQNELITVQTNCESNVHYLGRIVNSM
ncbi:MAG: hypothetical protein QXL18_04670 [Candidatus Woesearchaeota archaeon]